LILAEESSGTLGPEFIIDIAELRIKLYDSGYAPEHCE